MVFAVSSTGEHWQTAEVLRKRLQASGLSLAEETRNNGMTFDWDDAYTGHDALDRFHYLKDLRADFKCTLFAIPGYCTPEWCEAMPEWVELAVHGWRHTSNYECSNWGRQDLATVLSSPTVARYFAPGFKAPGWQISDACYAELADRGWWVADQHLEDGRRPPMRVYFYEDGGWHGHIDNVCGNGIEETWETVVGLVVDAAEFRFCGEAARQYPHPDDPEPVSVAGGMQGVGVGADLRSLGAPVHG